MTITMRKTVHLYAEHQQSSWWWSALKFTNRQIVIIYSLCAIGLRLYVINITGCGLFKSPLDTKCVYSFRLLNSVPLNHHFNQVCWQIKTNV